MAVAKPLHLRLFLEGIEVPVVSAQVSIGINGPASASVQIIPHDLGFQFKPRTMVHLFYLDADPSNAQLDAGRSLGDYRLLFGGEIIGFSVQMTPMSRGLVLQCVDFSAYWDACHATAIEYGPGGNAFTDTGWLVGSNTSQFDDIINQQANKLVGWLRQKPKTEGLTTVSGLAGGIIRMLEAIGGLPGVTKGVNDFFTIAQLRCRILEQIVAEENDSTAERLLSVSVFDEWVRNGLQNAGQQVTFRDLLGILFQYIYYETVPNPVAMYQEGVRGKVEKTPRVVTQDLLTDPFGAAAYKKTSDLRALVIQRAGSGASPEDLPGFLKVVVKGRYLAAIGNSLKGVAINAKVDAQAKLTMVVGQADRLAQGSHKFSDLESLIAPIDGLLKFFDDSKTSTAVTRTVFDEKLIGAKSARLNSQIIRPDCWFSAPPVCNVIFPEQYVSFNYDRNFLSEVTRVLLQFYSTLVGPDKLLTNKIVAPNMAGATKRLGTFAPSAGYRVIMDHEVHTGIIPREEMLPNTTSIAADKSSTDRLSAKRDRMSWAQRVALFHYFRYRYASRGCSVGGKFNPNVVCGFPAAVLTRPYYVDQATINSLVEMTGRGETPAPSSHLRYALDNADELHAPTHFVGMVGSVNHSLDQNGGTTSVSMHHTRQVGGKDDEFIQMAQDLKSVERTIQVTLDFEKIAAMEKGAQQEALLKFLVGVTPQSDTVTVRPAPTVLATPSAAAPAPTSTPTATWAAGGVPLVYALDPSGKPATTTTSSTKPAAVKDTSNKPKIVPIALTKKYSELGKTYTVPNDTARIVRGAAGLEGKGKVKIVEVADSTLVSSSTVKAISKGVSGRAFRRVIIHENIDLPVNAKIPAEEVIRPRGWFSEKYANEAIGGGIYTPFFGCGSVIDGLRVQLNEAEYLANPTSQGETVVDPTASINMVEAVAFTESEKLFHSVERAMTALAYIYGKVKTEGGDVDAFIRAYTRRPIATKTQILGSEDLILKVNSQASIEATKGSFGFYTHAVHPDLVDRKEKMYGLVGDPTRTMPRINDSGDKTPYLGAYDVRREKWEAVKAYADMLREGRAFQG